MSGRYLQQCPESSKSTSCEKPTVRGCKRQRILNFFLSLLWVLCSGGWGIRPSVLEDFKRRSPESQDLA
jgi:hypothetical protein